MGFKKRAKKNIALALVSMIVAGAGINNIYALENKSNVDINQVYGTNEETETVNEYVKLRDLSRKNDSALKKIGYSTEDIKEIRDYKNQFRKHINTMNKLSNKELTGLGYDNEQINIIRNFDGSENQMIRASAKCTVTRSKSSFTYTTSTKTSKLTVNIGFKWSGAPIFRGTDLMAVYNGEQMYYTSDSYLKISYYPLNSSGASSTKTVKAKIHDAGNTGASFSFKVLGNSGLSYAKSGSGKVYLTKKKKLSEVGVGVKYGHTTIKLGSPGVSFPLGVGITFERGIEEIGPNPLRCYR